MFPPLSRAKPVSTQESSTQALSASRTKLPTWVRALLLLSGCGAIALLLTAASLTPDERGIGTHQQLGLGPCTVRQLWGIRCPACGMTTSWSQVTKGQLFAGLQANVSGVLLAFAAGVYGMWSVASGIRGHWLVALADWQLLIIVLGLLGFTFTEWLIRLGIAGS